MGELGKTLARLFECFQLFLMRCCHAAQRHISIQCVQLFFFV